MYRCGISGCLRDLGGFEFGRAWDLLLEGNGNRGSLVTGQERTGKLLQHAAFDQAMEEFPANLAAGSKFVAELNFGHDVLTAKEFFCGSDGLRGQVARHRFMLSFQFSLFVVIAHITVKFARAFFWRRFDFESVTKLGESYSQ